MDEGLSGRQIVGETLRILQLDLESRVAPQLSDPDARLAARMISDLLAFLAMWHLDLPKTLPSHLAARRLLVNGAEANSALLPGDLPVEGGEYAILAGLIQDRIESDPALDIGSVVAALAADQALYAEEQARLVEGAVLARERLASVEVEVTEERARQFAEAILGAGRGVVSLARVPGGMSKESFFLGLSDAAGARSDYLIRRDLPWGPAQTTVRDEYVVLSRLFQLGLPIARPFGCDLTGILGQPAMLSARVPGASGTEPWGADPEARRAVCTDLAEQLARLHQIEPASVGVKPVSDEPREQVRAYVLEWRERWRKNRVHASPTLAAAFAWLLDNIPSRVDRVSIVHGDVGFHNMIVDHGRLVALLDWEFFHAGDPTEDLSYCRQFVEPLMPWPDFLAAYAGAGGGDYAFENAQFFELWRSVRNSITCSVAWRGFLDGAYPALKMALQGTSIYRHFVRTTAQALQERLK